MAHEWDTGYVVGKRSWHGLENLLTTYPATIEDIRRESGVVWEPELIGVQSLDGQAIEGWKAIRRSDNRRVLGVVTDSYGLYTNRQFFERLRPFINAGLKVEVCASLREGRTVFALARLDIPQSVKDGDAIEPFALFSIGHDGRTDIDIAFTTVRVVCANTHAMALAQFERSGNHQRVIHRAGVADAVDAVMETIDLQRRTFNVTMEQYCRMAEMPINQEQLKRFVAGVIETKVEDFSKSRMAQAILRCAESAPGAEPTLWGAFNAVTAWTTHERGRTDASRTHANLFGQGRAYANRAYELAGAVLEGKRPLADLEIPDSM